MKSFEGYKKGVNLGGWLSQCDHTKERYDNFIRKEDIEKISSWGADHVRLPIDYNLVEDNEGNVIESGYEYIDNAIKWCSEAGMKLVLDLHKTAGFSFDKGENESGLFDSEALQERFYKLWDKLAERYASYSDKVAYELLNEVTDKSYSDAWNKMIPPCIERIRAKAPDTTIIVGGYWNNSPDALPDIVIPDDGNVVLSFHCYDPLNFTHQGAPWVDGMDTSFRMSLNEAEVTPEYFEERFKAALETAEKYDAPLYCGEYGVIDRASPEEVLKWYQAIHAAHEKFNISRCTWSYKQMDFGISDERMSGVIDELIKYL